MTNKGNVVLTFSMLWANGDFRQHAGHLSGMGCRRYRGLWKNRRGGWEKLTWVGVTEASKGGDTSGEPYWVIEPNERERSGCTRQRELQVQRAAAVVRTARPRERRRKWHEIEAQSWAGMEGALSAL